MTLADKLQRLKGDEIDLVEHLVDRLLMGQEPYGVWHAEKERRNLWAETRDEHLDAVAYLAMDAIRRAREQSERRQCARRDEAFQRVADAWKQSSDAVTMSSWDVLEGKVLEVAR